MILKIIACNRSEMVSKRPALVYGFGLHTTGQFVIVSHVDTFSGKDDGIDNSLCIVF